MKGRLSRQVTQGENAGIRHPVSSRETRMTEGAAPDAHVAGFEVAAPRAIHFAALFNTLTR